MKKILLLATIVMIISCKKNNGDVDSQNSSTTDLSDARKAEIEKTQFYIANQWGNITDKDGISHKLSFIVKETNRIPQFKGESIKEASTFGCFWIYDVLSTRTSFEFIFKDNGEIVGSSKYDGYTFEINKYFQTRGEATELKPTKCISNAYIPELTFKSVFWKSMGYEEMTPYITTYLFFSDKKEVISSFTNPSELRPEGNAVNLLAQTTIKAVKASGILN